MMKSVFWWRKPEHPEETTDLRQVATVKKLNAIITKLEKEISGLKAQMEAERTVSKLQKQLSAAVAVAEAMKTKVSLGTIY